MLKKAVLVLCVLFLYLIFLNQAINDEIAALIGSVAATVLTVFLYAKLARKTGI